MCLLFLHCFFFLIPQPWIFDYDCYSVYDEIFELNNLKDLCLLSQMMPSSFNPSFFVSFNFWFPSLLQCFYFFFFCLFLSKFPLLDCFNCFYFSFCFVSQFIIFWHFLPFSFLFLFPSFFSPVFLYFLS